MLNADFNELDESYYQSLINLVSFVFIDFNGSLSSNLPRCPYVFIHFSFIFFFQFTFFHRKKYPYSPADRKGMPPTVYQPSSHFPMGTYLLLQKAVSRGVQILETSTSSLSVAATMANPGLLYKP
jgi:hypothetical protein